MHSKNQRRHGSPSTSRAPLVPMKPKEPSTHSRGGGGSGGAEALAFRVPRDYPHARFSKAPLAVYPPKGARTAKACVSLPVVSLEKMPCFGRTEGSHVKVSSASLASSTSSFPSSSSSQSPSASFKSSLSSSAHKPSEKFVNGRGPATPRSVTPPSSHDGRRSPSRSPLDKRSATSTPSQSPSSQDRRPSASPSPSSLDKRPSAPPSPLEKKQTNGAKGSGHKRVSGRIFDPNKHCGVLDPGTKRPCTRSLTCKTHSLTHRRAVAGRKKDFDILLAEHKGRAKEKEVGPKRDTQTGAHLNQSHDTTTSGASHYSNGKTTSSLRLRLANAHMNSRSLGSSSAAKAPPTQDPAPMLPRSTTAAESRLSSDEGEAEVPEDRDKLTCHYAPRHPRPMSCCAFNSRLMGRGHFVFDRRWDKMRLVLHSMVEKHVNSQMWKRVPLASESVASNTPSPSDSSSCGSGPLSSPLFASPATPQSLDGVSVVSYSTPFSQNGAGIFCIRDPDPPTPASATSASVSSSAKPPRTKPAKPSKAQTESPGAKRRKAPDGSSLRKNGTNFYQPPRTPPQPSPLPVVSPSLGPGGSFSNGTGSLGAKNKSPTRSGQVPYRDSCRNSGGGQVSTSGSLQGHHIHTLGSHAAATTAAIGTVDVRKRKSSGAVERPTKMAKTVGLDGVFRKSSLSLLAPLPESPHTSHLRQSKVQH